MAQVTVTPAALAELAKLPRVIRERIGRLFVRLESWPAVSGAKPL
jgi:mRNA-degrading endonuclease RelE of RelBE toxin-antitoxin system